MNSAICRLHEVAHDRQAKSVARAGLIESPRASAHLGAVGAEARSVVIDMKRKRAVG